MGDTLVDNDSGWGALRWVKKVAEPVAQALEMGEQVGSIAWAAITGPP